jgi:hypothetical protein
MSIDLEKIHKVIRWAAEGLDDTLMQQALLYPMLNFTDHVGTKEYSKLYKAFYILLNQIIILLFSRSTTQKYLPLVLNKARLLQNSCKLARSPPEIINI